ncbi:hypothetical protein BVRB_1g015490 [Beta vulgaris subsp. vulgaris]|nr:hypothetical protein BVRB_1g015490 [Beta vulgaris subsp. vulgaris]
MEYSNSADAIFASDDLSAEEESWLLRKLDRYNNESSYESYRDKGGYVAESSTATSKLVVKPDVSEVKYTMFTRESDARATKKIESTEKSPQKSPVLDDETSYVGDSTKNATDSESESDANGSTC